MRIRLRRSVIRRSTRALIAVCLAAFALLVAVNNASASDLPWPNRNGPDRNGNVTAADSKGVPVEWDEETGTNVKWKIPLEGFGHSTPVIGNRQIWLTAATKDGTRQFVYCLNADTGDIVHHRLLFENADPEPLGNDVNTYASPSCALEDDAVYVHFGTYGTARLNPKTADTVWERRDINVRHFRGPGSSPVLYENLLILTFDGINAQFLTALDKHSGETVWKTERTTDYGDLDENGQPKLEGDLRKAYSTPGLVEVDGRTQVVSVGSRAAFSYDALTGEELWTITHDDFNAAAPPLFFQGMAILNTGSRSSNLLAVRLEDSTRGNVDQSHVVWNREKGNSRLAAPLLLGDRIYMINDTGAATCVNANNGDTVWQGRIGGTHVASPIAANGLVYFSSEEGDTTVIKAADEFEIVAKNHLAEGMRASLAAAYGRIYLRSFGHLYCLGE
ncbi:MAG: PQQ-binding-like beta-propeller repeat protein [Planctomycetaceae bacterium]